MADLVEQIEKDYPGLLDQIFEQAVGDGDHGFYISIETTDIHGQILEAVYIGEDGCEIIFESNNNVGSRVNEYEPGDLAVTSQKETKEPEFDIAKGKLDFSKLVRKPKLW